MFDFKAPLRDQLTPRRLTIAMWDFSFLLRRTAGEGFEDWDRRLDELVERGYNTVRIDTFPELILAAQGGQEEFFFPSMHRPHFLWGNVADVTVRPRQEIPQFLRKATQRGRLIDYDSLQSKVPPRVLGWRWGGRGAR